MAEVCSGYYKIICGAIYRISVRMILEKQLGKLLTAQARKKVLETAECYNKRSMNVVCFRPAMALTKSTSTKTD